MGGQVQSDTTNVEALLRIVYATSGIPHQTIDTGATNLALWYRRTGGGKTAITAATHTTLTDAHTNGGMFHIDDGYYRLDVPDAAFATGASQVVVGGAADDVIVVGDVFQIVGYDPSRPIPSTSEITDDIFGDSRAGIAHNATLTGAAASNVTVSANSFVTNHLVGGFVYIRSGTGLDQQRAIVSNTSNVVSVQPDWETTPTGAIAQIMAGAPVTTDTREAIATNVWEHGTRDLTSATNFNDLSIANVWDATATSYATSGSMGESVQAAAAEATAIATAVWEHGARDLTSSTNFALLTVGDVFDATATSYATAGSMGEKVGLIESAASIRAEIDSNSTQLASVVAQLDVIQADTTLIVAATAQATAVWEHGTRTVDSVAGAVGSVSGNVAGNLGGTITGFTATAKSEINAEVVDTLETDTLAELSQGIPTATPTIKTALMLLYMAIRNKRTVTATEDGVYDDAGTKIAKSALSDDGTTFTRGEMASGA